MGVLVDSTIHCGDCDNKQVEIRGELSGCIVWLEGICQECGWILTLMELKDRKQSVQNTPKNRLSESQQTQGVKSSDLGVQKGNVL